MDMKKTYMAPVVEVLNVEAESMVCESLPVVDSPSGEVTRAVKERNDFEEFGDVVNLF